MSADVVGLSLVVLSLLLLAGYWLRLLVKPFQKYFIPSSIIAGFLGLFSGPQILGSIVGDKIPAPLIFQWGLVPVLILTAILCIGWFLFGFFRFGKREDLKQ